MPLATAGLTRLPSSFLAYVVRGIAGFREGLIAVPLLALVAPITAVVPVVVSLGIALLLR